MVNIKTVKISNFMGIRETTLHLPNDGIINVMGRNKDSTTLTSNGSGKTTIFLAILQGLFNKIPDMDLDNINNIDTNVPYLIEITVKVKDDIYLVVNDRNSLQITVTKNARTVATRIRESLRYIEHEILGVSYNEFLLLTRVTTGSIKSLFEVTSSNLLLKLFNLHELDVYETKLKKQKASLNTQLRTVGKNINKSSTPFIDKEKIEGENLKLLDKVSRLTIINDRLTNEAQSQKKDILKDTDIFLGMIGGACKSCGQQLPLPLDTSKSAEELKDLIHLEEARHGVKVELIKANLWSINDLNSHIQRNNTRLLISQEFIEHDLTELRQEQSNLKVHIKYLEDALNVILRGDIHLHFLSQFLKVLNTLLKESDTEHQITAYLDKTSIYYRVKTDGMSKSIKQLSGGESTVIGLTILSTIFTTINTLIGKNINLLVFDEAIHATDSISEEIISSIVKGMKEKAIFVIQHHDEIPVSTFTGTLYIEKLNKETRIVDGF